MPRAWSVVMLQSGGMRGGMRAFSADSAHARDCTPPVANAVAAAHPDAWQRSYPDTSPGLTDQFHYTLTLEAEGKKYQSSWSSGSGDSPPDLVRLAGALQQCR
jgi:hypothetical protein